MLSNNITLHSASGAAVIYNLQSNLPDGTRRIDTLSDYVQPRILEIKHTATGKGPAMVDRHLVSFSSTKNDATTAGEKKLVLNFTIANSRSTAFSAAEVCDLVSELVDFLTPDTKVLSSNRVMIDPDKVAALLRGES